MFNTKLSIIPLIIFSIACGGGGGGGNVISSSSHLEEVIKVPSVNESDITETEKRFSYKMTDTINVSINVTGINQINNHDCVIQIRTLSDNVFSNDTITWKEYIRQDKKVIVDLDVPSTHNNIEVIVHQVNMIDKTQSLNEFNLLQPSYHKMFDNEDINIDVTLIHRLNNNVKEKSRQKSSIVDRNISVPDIVLETVNALLPEGVVPNASYLDTRYNPNLPIIDNAEIEVTFIHEGAGYRNSFGYFVYYKDSNGNITITERNMIFPNTSYRGSGGELRTGDTVKLKDASGNVRIFQPNETVGFFLIANGYDGVDGVTGFDPLNPIYPSTEPSVNRGPSSLNAKGTLSTLDEINPENFYDRSDISRHVAMIKIDGISDFMNGDDFLIVGMEDIQRNMGSDNDFNDCVFVVSANPITAIGTQDIISYDTENPDADLDSISDANDVYPNDPTRAYTERVPEQGYWTLVYEDLYPTVGDADYNDLVISYFYEKVFNGFGEVKEFQATFHLLARGSSLDHAFGLAFPFMETVPSGEVYVENFHAELGKLVNIVQNTNNYEIAKLSGNTMLRMPVVNSTVSLLPGINSIHSSFANTTRKNPEQAVASARCVIVFDTAQSPTPFLSQNIDPFLWVNNGYAMIDVHLPGFEGFSDRPTHLPLETGPNSFLSDEGHPWVMKVPTDFRYPLEGVNIADEIQPAYQEFKPWVESKGEFNKNWYLTPSDNVVIKKAPNGRSRSWSIGR